MKITACILQERYTAQAAALRERHLFDQRPELYGAIVDPEPGLKARYPDTRMHALEQNRPAAFRRYRAAWDRLHWQTRPDRKTSQANFSATIQAD